MVLFNVSAGSYILENVAPQKKRTLRSVYGLKVHAKHAKKTREESAKKSLSAFSAFAVKKKPS